jgi:hypothetical protein
LVPKGAKSRDPERFRFDETDEKRERVAFRAEGAYRGGRGNGHDLDAAGKLIRKDDAFVNADAGYTGSVRRYKRTNIWQTLITGLTREKGLAESGMPKCIRIQWAILAILDSRTGTGISNT